jgi:putative tricarboxylic transport membrane protein
MSPTTVVRPFWLAAIVIALGGVCLWGASSLPAASRYAGIGPGAFAMIIGAALVVLGVILGFQIWHGEKFEAQGTENADADAPANRLAFALALAAAVVPILTIRNLGLPITAMISFALVARSFGSRALAADIITGAVLGSLSWFLFDRLGLQLGSFLPIAGF